jgi:hypothetical protein
MKPRVRIAAARIPSGSEMVLYQHDRDFSITINGQELMHSRRHESESTNSLPRGGGEQHRLPDKSQKPPEEVNW